MLNNINTSNHLDKMVVYLFAATFLVSATVFAIKYTQYTPCEDVRFTINAKDFTVDKIIRFEDNTNGAKSWEWHFGDSTITSQNKTPIHVFKKPGEYKVHLRVNGICEKTEIVAIKARKVNIDSTKFPVFSIPESIVVGEPLKIIDQTINAKTWEWRFGETAKVNATEKEPEYTYTEPGLKTISLIVNGNLNYITKKKINVLPKIVKEEVIAAVPDNDDAWKIKNKPNNDIIGIKDKPADEPKEKEIPYISEAAFEKKLLKLADEKLNPSAF
ncbi:MAG: PKD domain-containing protein, partial [Oceanihabitans sp.]